MLVLKNILEIKKNAIVHIIVIIVPMYIGPNLLNLLSSSSVFTAFPIKIPGIIFRTHIVIEYSGFTTNINIKNVAIKDITECFLSVNVPIIAYGTGTAILSILNIGTYAVIKHNKIPNAVISDA